MKEDGFNPNQATLTEILYASAINGDLKTAEACYQQFAIKYKPTLYTHYNNVVGLFQCITT